MKKRGFTLIEMVVVMSLVFLMVGAINSMITSYMKTYNNSLLENQGFNYLNEAIAIIEKEVNGSSCSVKTEGNIIKINYY